MAAKHQKDIEMLYAEKAGELLGVFWKIEPSPDEINWPDLIITTGLEKIGLEVREIYHDETNRGSLKKASEKNNLDNINNLANAYYKRTCTSIKADFLGYIGHYDQLLHAIISAAEQLSEFEQKRIEPYDDCVINLRRLPSRFGEYKRWNYVSDKIGFVRKIDKTFIDKFIVEKAKNLPKYTKIISDVSLLLVSDRTFNSGKAQLTTNIICDTHGFKNVYYLSYPDIVYRLSKPE